MDQSPDLPHGGVETWQLLHLKRTDGASMEHISREIPLPPDWNVSLRGHMVRRGSAASACPKGNQASSPFSQF